MDRIVSKLIRHKPGAVTIVTKPEEADLLVLHVVSYNETAHSIRRIKALGKQYAIIQYNLLTTDEPDVSKWVPLWADAAFVWSYYDLPRICREHGQQFPEDTTFLFAPLGVDTEFFHRGPNLAKYPHKVVTTGTLAPNECVDLVNIACHKVFPHPGAQVHIGHLTEIPETFNASIVQFEYDISDLQLSQIYRQTEYVSGLRRVEGFELPAAEGLICNAVPILFDKPHYRDWFGELGALFIPEGSDEEIIKALVGIFSQSKPTWTPRNIEGAKKLFNWQNICTEFWKIVLALIPHASTVRVQNPTRRLLWIGDAVAATGFAKCTHQILETVRKDWDIAVLGLNYYGDPHQYPYHIFPAMRAVKGDAFGISRIPQLVDVLRPEVVVVQNDPWNFPNYMRALGTIPTVGIVAVDGLNCRGEALNGLRHAIFWTEFGAKEAAAGGYRGTSSVIPLGVDLELYKPIDKDTARDAMGLPARQRQGFIVGNINRNQPRKRLDLTIQFFCEWVRNYRIDDAYLYLHIAPTADQGYDAKQLMRYFGLNGRLILMEPEVVFGLKEQVLPYVYNSFDIQVTTTQGEGFGLTTLEGMACGVPQILPNWSALGDLFYECCDMVPCSTTACTPNMINVVGGVPDKDAFIALLNRLYKNPTYRLERSSQVLAKAAEARFRWEDIGQRYLTALETTFTPSVQLHGH